MTPKKFFYSTFIAGALIISTIAVGVPMYLEHRAKASFTIVPIPDRGVSAVNLDGPPPQKVEILNTSFDQGGAVKVVARRSYETGQQDECTFMMVVEPATGGVNFTQKSQICKTVTLSN